ncbi:hypothetical protein F2Q70_00003212 [Brassica cretica]|uniref:Uncharacterized protein n=1 Tax=Brassica cretica TaxID=69181 RepID=A0A8S9IM75_BRACR|nr:hypothetical protein F2Q70_00003212 [Brassica cretica]
MLPAKKESARFLEESKEHPVSSNRTGPSPPVYPLRIRALGSTVSKTSSEAQCSLPSTRISGPNSTRLRSDVGKTDHPPGSEYGSGLSGTWDRGITGAMSCLREAC